MAPDPGHPFRRGRVNADAKGFHGISEGSPPAPVTPLATADTEPRDFPIIGQAQIAGAQVNAVDARELHSFLGIGKIFAAWMPEQITRARLVEDRDFVVRFPKSESESHGGQNRKEYFVTFDAAKQIGMMCGTDKGFEIRD